MDRLVEDVILYIFERMYRELFALEGSLPANRYADVAYEDFCAAPVETLRAVYDQLGLEGFAAAEPAFRAFADSQKGYRKNKLDLPPELVRRINERLGFYLERYGYEREEAAEE